MRSLYPFLVKITWPRSYHAETENIAKSAKLFYQKVLKTHLCAL